MSRRAAIVEEEFDDDTDLPLPAHLLPNTGARGPILQELGDSDDDDDDHQSDDVSPSALAGPARVASAPSSASAPLGRPVASSGVRTVTDITPYKTWTCVYPIYLDAKRPYGTGERRIERPKALWWPLSKDIADACTRLGLGTLHEVNKSHPRDWENPGRVRVQWKKDGKLVNLHIKTKKQLLEMISIQIQMLKPENIPKAPYIFTSDAANTTTLAITSSPAPTSAPPTPHKDKGKQPAKSKQHPQPPTAPNHHHQQPNQHPTGRRLPIPPGPHPPLQDRVSQYSPAISSGVLVETVKAGMNASNEGLLGGPGGPGQGGPGGGAGGASGKGKRKVVRVRA